MPHSDELASRDVLSVSGLNIAFHHEGQQVDAVRNLSLRLKRGETLAIVGESGSGKIGDGAGVNAADCAVGR